MGWLYESALCSVREKRFINRGFLNGPVCPVYGFGALSVLLILDHRTDNIFFMFLAGMLLTCTVEYITAVLLEKLFHAKWWDYSGYHFNLHGRICLWGAVIFGFLSVLLIKYIHPWVMLWFDRLSDKIVISVTAVCLAIIAADLYITVRHLVGLNERLREIQMAFNYFVAQSTKKAEGVRATLLEKFEESEYYNEHIKKLFGRRHFQDIRLAAAFPRLKHQKYNDAWVKLKNALPNKSKRNESKTL